MSTTISNLQIYDYPNNIAGDPTPIFSWAQVGSPTLYEIQINYGINSFSNPLVDAVNFISTNNQYLLSPEFSLSKEGTYYARMRGYDGTWGTYSPTLKFTLSLFPATPPIINQVISPSHSFNQIISGTKNSGLYVYVRNNGGTWGEATYPNGILGSIWNYNIALSNGDNNISVSTSVTHTTIGAMSREINTYIYLATITPEVYNVWNSFDEMGLLLSLQRNPGEKNLPYRSRLIDVYANPGNSTYNGLMNAIARELGVSQSEISINTLSSLMNPNYPGNLLNQDNNAIGTPLEQYAEEVYQNNPVFLGTVISDQSYWDGVNQNTNGYIFLPHIWDANASGIYPKWQAGGIGDQDDLWVNGPIAVWNSGILDYSWYVTIHTGFFYSANPSGLI